MVKTTPRIIGLYSTMPGMGKTTAATALVEHLGFRRIPFAQSLKRMTEVFLSEQGLDEHEIEFVMNGGKELPLEALFGVTPRWVMQSLGTDWGRTCIHQNVWLRSFIVKANKALVNNRSIVVDDVRFDNEARLIKSVGGAVFRVHRPDAIAKGEVLEHASEQGIDSELIAGSFHNAHKGPDAALRFQHDVVDTIVESGVGQWNHNFFQIPTPPASLPEPAGDGNAE